ncbi:hypothetical protein ASPVEDRAFT_644899 [Aspergillus versicolor CBS 583.65]|uniref:Uncharacterized protein n=1 Tax=Aspergillus versicolor CBS 583.65 TaxID=1036611 RepID=A0A1L9PJB8_ASPVE|nr:uncharacterized protein ASPVEDRAFT_644899 [Aspergillus versicolor CBS 583.65]OJJ01618.1 hypothetical protein ASPVEDRAFT_644899 [Aspergillus versicolor CBS 583.65]
MVILQGSTFKLTSIISQPCLGVGDPGSARNPQNAIGTRPPQSNPSPSLYFYTCRLTATWALSGRVLERQLLHGFKTGRANGVWGSRLGPADILRSALRCRRSLDIGPFTIAWGALNFDSQQGSPCHPLQESTCNSQGLSQFLSNSNRVVMAPRPSQHHGHLRSLQLMLSHL